jgi:hypothetical protein
MTASRKNVDLLDGVEQIAAFIGKDRRSTQHACATGQLPVFKFLDRWHMRPAAYIAHIERLEAEAVTGRK